MIKRTIVFIHRMLSIMSRQQKMLGLLMLLLSLVGALFEMVGVGIIIPLVQAFVNIEQLTGNLFLIPVFDFFNVETANEIIIFMIIGIIMIFLVKNIYFVILSWMRAKYSNKVEKELSVTLMEKYMSYPYSFFLKQNVADLIRNLHTDVVGVNQILHQSFRVIVDVLIIVFIVGYVFFTDWIIAIGVSFFAVLCIGIIFGFFRKNLKNAGDEYGRYYAAGQQCLIQSFQGVKEVFVLQKQKYFIKEFKEICDKKQAAMVRQTVGSEAPTYVIEGVCIVGMLSTICFRVIYGNMAMSELIPVMAAFGVAAFRILPSLGKISGGLNMIVYYQSFAQRVFETMTMLNDENDDIDVNSADAQNYVPEHFLALEKLTWKYENTDKIILDDISLQIEAGRFVAFVGQSGTGKTTLMDIILGLLKPQKGAVFIEGKPLDYYGEKLHQIMGYVPQTIYLIDDTIRKNIAYGMDEKEIDDEKLTRAIKMAQLEEFINELPAGVETFVGDRGTRVSGGQRQRIAIARALYENPKILIFDEATAALDNETESDFMESIDMLKGKKTIIMVAHRISTIKNCDKIYELVNGKLVSRQYEDLKKASQ